MKQGSPAEYSNQSSAPDTLGKRNPGHFQSVLLCYCLLLFGLTALYLLFVNVLIDVGLASGYAYVMACAILAISSLGTFQHNRQHEKPMPRSYHDQSQKIIHDVIDTLNHTNKAETIHWLLTDELPRRLHIQSTLLWVLEAPGDWRFVQVGADSSNSLMINGSSISYLRHHSDRLFFRIDQSTEEWSDSFRRAGLNMVFPLRINHRLIGIYGMYVPISVSDSADSLIDTLLQLIPIIANALEHVRSTLIITRLNTEISVLDQLKDELIENIGHELRTPLTSLSIASQMLARHPEMVTDLASTIEENVTRLERIIKRVMQVQHTHITPKIDIVEIDLAPLVESVIDAYAAELEGRNLGLETSITHGMAVLGEHYRLRQAIAEVLENAIRYSLSGVICIKAKIEDSLAIITISDQGRGIPEDERHFLFSRFYRGRAVRALASTPGVGVGLVIAQRAIESIGGHIWLEASGPQGSIMSIALPASLKKKTPDDSDILERFVGNT